MNATVVYTWFGIIAILILYFAGNYYLREAFVAQMELSPTDKEKTRTPLPDRPYATDNIDSLDTYEQSAVFQNEGSREAGRREISDAMSRYPLSWTARPPSDQAFQDYREAFVDASQKAMTDAPVQASNMTEKYRAVSGDNMIPPDTDAQDMEEKQILAMYNPETPQQLKEYSINRPLDRIKVVVKRIYDKRGLIADVEMSNQGQNVFEIVETRPIDEKIVWEDEVDNSSIKRAQLRNEGQIEVPVTVSDVAAGLDPFYEPRTRMRMDRSDYTQWTPGLERQFAPTYAKESWY
jgi:hypothetical protein